MSSRTKKMKHLATRLVMATLLILSSLPLYAQGVLFPYPRPQLEDNNGVVLSGGKLCSYQAGTTTPLATYSDSALSSANGNPVVLDSAGRPTSNGSTPTNVYLLKQSYKFVLLSAGSDGTCSTGTTLWTADNVPGGYDASVIIAGTMATARLGSGSATSGTFLRGDSTWATPSGSDFATCDLRLTLTTATPVTTADVTAATTVYVSPLNGGRCGFYDGSATWTVLTNSETSFSVPATTSTLYDVWCRNNAGTIACDTTAWTNDTTRATALTTQNAVLVKTGDTTRRYVGSFRTTTVSGQTEDSVTKRYVWSYYQRRPRVMFKTEATASWTYTTATWRQANGATANQLDFVIGFADQEVVAVLTESADNSTTGGVAFNSIGEDSTTVPSVHAAGGGTNPSTNTGNWVVTNRYYPAVGRHTLVWLEYSTASGTTTFYGTKGPSNVILFGLSGTIWG